MTLKTRIIPCLDVKDGKRRPQRPGREDAQNKDSAVR
jgi:imidazole glycerol phosphate synthase subunit HisF